MDWVKACWRVFEILVTMRLASVKISEWWRGREVAVATPSISAVKKLRIYKSYVLGESGLQWSVWENDADGG